MKNASPETQQWPPEVQYSSGSESHSTQIIAPEDYCWIVPSPGPAEYARLIEAKNREYELLGEKLLHEVVDSIGRLAALKVDGETQQLLDAAIQHQEMDPCDDLEGWASRLADDVKDADD